MKKKLSSQIILIALLVATSISSSYADGWFSFSSRGVAPVNNKLYTAECSACHYAYQPGLLPGRSWKKLFSNLENHFGEDASLSQEETRQLMQYAIKNAADKSDYKRSVKINRSISTSDTPIRITDIPYIKRKHHELSKRHVENNPKVQSLGRCDACHTKIDKGSFSENEINIPGFGRWED